MSETFYWDEYFHCRLEFCRHRNVVAPSIYRGVSADLSRGLSPTELTHQFPWAKANMAIDVRNICWDDCFALSIGLLSPTELIHQFPWAKANMAIDVRNICWDDCFALSIGLLSPTELIHQFPWAKANMAIDVRNICWGDCFSLSIGIMSPMKCSETKF